jgi:hypothetical protein
MHGILALLMFLIAFWVSTTRRRQRRPCRPTSPHAGEQREHVVTTGRSHRMGHGPLRQSPRPSPPSRANLVFFATLASQL